MQTHNDLPSLRAIVQASGTFSSVSRYTRGASLFTQGTDGDNVMHVEHGRVGLTVTAPSGKEAICGLLGPGTFLGEGILTGCAARPYTAVALLPTEVLVIGKARFLHLLHTDRRFAERFVAHTVSRSTRLASDLTDQLLYSSEERLARVLLTLADCDEATTARCALPHVSQEFIARMVGTTRSRVNLFLGRLKKRGFVEVHGGVLQIRPALLHGLSAQEHSLPPAEALPPASRTGGPRLRLRAAARQPLAPAHAAASSPAQATG